MWISGVLLYFEMFKIKNVEQNTTRFIMPYRESLFEDSSILGHDVVSLGLWFRTFRRNVIPLPS